MNKFYIFFIFYHSNLLKKQKIHN